MKPWLSWAISCLFVAGVRGEQWQFGQLSLSGSERQPAAFGLFEGKPLPPLTRAISVEGKIQNDHPSFYVRVRVDRKDRVYYQGDLLTVFVRSSRNGYLYLFNRRVDGQVVCIFPNKYQRENLITTAGEVVVPGQGAPFHFRITPPLGTEALIALVSLERLEPDKFGARSFTEKIATPVDKDALVRVAKAVLPESNYAEHSVTIYTRERPGTTPGPATQPSRKHRRLGLFIGVSHYRDENIPDLHVSHKDAIALAKLMEELGRLDGGLVLTNEHATLAKIRAGIAALADQSRPGDEVFIYFSGHGAKCADDNGDEPDGKDELLIPYDGVPRADRIHDTMLLDDTFGRWLQSLDGRKVIIIIDACHAAGMVSGEKAASDFSLSRNEDRFDFLTDELEKIAALKDISQRNSALLLASQSDETAKERRDGTLSVMTYYLIEAAQRSSQVTLDEAFQYLKPRVIEYVRQHFQGSPQTPKLLNNAGTIYLRP